MSSNKSSKPSIVLIPGSFSPLSFYSQILDGLGSCGFTTHGIELQTVGRREKAPSMYDDAAAVHALVERLSDSGEDIVVMAHSYGGIVANECARGLAKFDRNGSGKPGGIIRFIFLTAVVPSEGQSLTSIMGDDPVDFITVEGEYMSLEPKASAAVNFSDLPKEEALAWAVKMPEHAAGSFGQSLTYAAYKHIPVSYVFCEGDKCISPALQREMVSRMESESGVIVDKHTTTGAHCINASQPETIVEIASKIIGSASG